MSFGPIEIITIIILLSNLLLLIFLIPGLGNTFIEKFIPNEYPLVSVLVAARNEELNLPRCIESLRALDYPLDRIEFLIGDDQSSDESSKIIKAYQEKDKRVIYQEIIPERSGLAAKANVLAQLAGRAKGEFFLFVDADVAVNPQWARGMVASFNKNENVGMVNAITGVQGRGLWARLQDVEWIYSIGMLRVLSNAYGAVTGIGNNMAITRKAYNKINGLEGIPFSLAEDHALFKAIGGKGYKVEQIIHRNVFARTVAETDLKDLLNQRKRWMLGASKLPFWIILILGTQASRLIGLSLSFVISWLLGSGMVLLFTVLDTWFLYRIKKDLGEKVGVLEVFLYQFYYGLLTPLVILYHYLPTPVYWKDRKYK